MLETKFEIQALTVNGNWVLSGRVDTLEEAHKQAVESAERAPKSLFTEYKIVRVETYREELKTRYEVSKTGA